MYTHTLHNSQLALRRASCRLSRSVVAAQTMLTFKANRSDPQLVPPALPTPRERKALSDVDTQPLAGFYVTAVDFFRRRRPVDGREPADPAKAIKAALAKALVYYYPMAGRLQELPGGKLVVECTGEGVVFVEADADVRLDELGEPLVPPYPCVEEFTCDPGDIRVVVGKPLVFMQVTRLKCGGFVIGAHTCHNMADGFGVTQFLTAIADIARGDEHPSVLPVWERQLLAARSPPDVTHLHSSYMALPDDMMQPMPLDDMVGHHCFFGPREVAALRSHLPAHLRESSTAFDLITAAMWRCRTAALGYAPGQRASMLIIANARGKWKRDPPLPQGFYGNGFVYLLVEATASELLRSSLGYAVELVRKAKHERTDEFAKAMVDLIASRGGPPYVPGWTYVVSDITPVGRVALDLGWAERVAGGVPIAGDITSKLVSYQMRCKNDEGDDCVAVSMFLPKPVMERFAEMSVLSNYITG